MASKVFTLRFVGESKEQGQFKGRGQGAPPVKILPSLWPPMK